MRSCKELKHKPSTYLTVNVAPVLFPVSGFIRATINHIKHTVRSRRRPLSEYLSLGTLGVINTSQSYLILGSKELVDQSSNVSLQYGTALRSSKRKIMIDLVTHNLSSPG